MTATTMILLVVIIALFSRVDDITGVDEGRNLTGRNKKK